MDEMSEIRAAAERWVEQLAGEDKRVLEAFLEGYATYSHVVERLTNLTALDGPESMPSSAIELVKGILQDDITDELNPKSAAEKVPSLIANGRDWPLGEYRRATEAVGLDISEILDEAMDVSRELRDGPVWAD